eukprot:scaffold12885_cov52-Prasinocladus_malaysianus.AAC.1
MKTRCMGRRSRRCSSPVIHSPNWLPLIGNMYSNQSLHVRAKESWLHSVAIASSSSRVLQNSDSGSSRTSRTRGSSSYG